MKIRKIRNKKAFKFLAPKFINMLIGIICLTLLFYLFFHLQDTSSLGKRQAKANIENMIKLSNNLNQEETEKYIILNPEDYFLRYFPLEEITPNSCDRKSCLCICPKDPTTDYTQCKQKGYCDGIENLKILTTCTTGDNSINPGGGWAPPNINEKTTYKNCLKLDNLPKDLFLTKNQDFVEISIENPELKK